MQKLKTPSLVFLIFIIAVFLRTYRIAELPPGLYPDEAMNGSNAFEAIATGNYKVYYPENNGREGLFMNIQAQFLKVLVPWNNGMPEPWMLRIASTIFGSLTVLGLYFLGKELFSKRVGLLASFFIATSFWHIMFSRIGFRAITAPFFLTWALYFLIVAIRKGRDGKSNAWILAAIVGGFLYGLGFYSYIAYRVSPFILLLTIPFFRTWPNFWKVAGIFAAVTFVTALPIGLYYLHNPADFLGRTSQVSIFSSPSPIVELGANILKTFGMFVVFGDMNERHNLSGAPELFWPIAIAFLVGIVLLLKKLRRDFGKLAIFVWFILALLPVVFSSEGIPHALRSILLIPPAMILAALGAVWIIDHLLTPLPYRWVDGLIPLIAVLLFAQAYYMYFVTWAKNPDTPGAFAANYVEIARSIRTLPPGTPVYVHVDTDGVLVRGIPMPAQTVMYMTDSFTSEKQQAKNIHYVVRGDTTVIPGNAVEYYIR